jgi:hypothetical protein
MTDIFICAECVDAKFLEKLALMSKAVSDTLGKSIRKSSKKM